MTIKHADIIRAILDGKTVQYQPPLDDKWYDRAPVTRTVVEVAEQGQGAWRVKPEPVVKWAPVWKGHSIGNARSCRAVANFADDPIQWLRLEFIDGRCVSVSVEDA